MSFIFFFYHNHIPIYVFTNVYKMLIFFITHSITTTSCTSISSIYIHSCSITFITRFSYLIYYITLLKYLCYISCRSTFLALTCFTCFCAFALTCRTKTLPLKCYLKVRSFEEIPDVYLLFYY